MQFMKRAIAVVSGGLDSVTLAYWLRAQGHELHLLAFDYGQRHKRELDCARTCAIDLSAELNVVDLSGLKPLLKGSALTDDIEMPHGHYAAPSMSATIVPNRNAIFLAIAYAAAVAENAQAVAIGVHGGDHFIYPDCRPDFIQSFAAMQKFAVAGCGDADLQLLAPFLEKTKSDIVKIGARIGCAVLKIPGRATKAARCIAGQCGTCIERKEAFDLAQVADPTEYAV